MTEDQKKNLETQLWCKGCPLFLANYKFTNQLLNTSEGCL